MLGTALCRSDRVRLDDNSCGFGDGDAVFEVDGRLIRAPKAVLCARCPHFRAMFASGMRESRGEPVQVDATYTTYRALLDYLLCDELDAGLCTEALLDLMMLSNAYGITRLEQLCARKLITRIDDDNLEAVGSCAQLIGASHLSRAVQRFSMRTSVEAERSPPRQDLPVQMKCDT